MENLNVSLRLLNEILGYLGTRPYQEVVGLVNALQDEFKRQADLISEEPKE
jgi:hypothetical protein